MSTTQSTSRMTMEDVLERRRGRKWAFWTAEELCEFNRCDPQIWLTACCPLAAVDCPAVANEDDELVCPRCRGTR